MTPTKKHFTLIIPHLALYWDGTEEGAKEIETALREFHPRWGKVSFRVFGTKKALCCQIADSPWTLIAFAAKPCWLLAKHDHHILRTYDDVEAINQHYQEV